MLLLICSLAKPAHSCRQPWTIVRAAGLIGRCASVPSVCVCTLYRLIDSIQPKAVTYFTILLRLVYHCYTTFANAGARLWYTI
jgi:hypothetical protein